MPVHHHHHHFIRPIIRQYADLHIHLHLAGQQGLTRTVTAALKSFHNTVTVTQVKYCKKTRKLEESIFSMLFLKTFKDAVFAVDGSALQTFITLSSEKLLSNASCAPSLKQFVLLL